MKLSGLPMSTCLQYNVQAVDGSGFWVTLDYPAELAELIRHQFTPQSWPEYEQQTLSELLWAFLPHLARRLNSPESWRSRSLLLPLQQRAAETLSFRLGTTGIMLPRTFSVAEVGSEDFIPPSSPSSRLTRLLLRLTQRRPATIPPTPAVSASPLVGTQAMLLGSEPVLTLQKQLEANWEKAVLSDDARWQYHAKAALTEYLPETVRLHGENGGSPDDPNLLQALANIHTIAHTRLSEGERRWQAHKRFLEEKARDTP